MELLERREDRGYPLAYLLSRIRGRRARLVRDWRSLLLDRSAREAAVESPDAPWRLLSREYRWVYDQMNGKLRNQFRSFFLYAELRPLCICLRRIQAGLTPGDDLLAASLLAPQVKAALRESPSPAAALERIEPALCELSSGFAGIAQIADTGGLRAVERQIVHRFLEYAVTAKLPPSLHSFFVMIIDARNLRGLALYLTLGMQEPPLFTPGGSVTVETLTRLAAESDLDGLTAVTRQVTGAVVRGSGPAFEIALYRSITRKLRSAGRDPLGTGLILDYLWRCSLEAMNLSLVLQAGDLEPDVVAAELVQ